MKIPALLLGLAGLALSFDSFAGSTTGRNSHIDIVKAKSTDIFVVRFVGEEFASVSVDGDGSTDLDCEVLDEGNHSVASDFDGTDNCRMSWTPFWTGKFKIRIINRGFESNLYNIRTN